MRFFVALEIPEKNRLELKKVQQKLQSLIPDIRITDNDKLHLTLAFLGQQPDNLQEKLIETIKKAVENIKPFEVTPAYIDGFPTIHNPHTLWVGVKGDVDKLIVLEERLEDLLKDLRLPVDTRRFIPHIAIAKTQKITIKDKLEADLGQIMAQHFEPIRISEIKLFESVADHGFHKHNTLAIIKLR